MEYKIIDLVFPILVHFLALQLTGILGIGDAAFQTMLAAVITMPLFFWLYRKDQNLWRKEKRKITWIQWIIVIVAAAGLNILFSALMSFLVSDYGITSESQDALLSSRDAVPDPWNGYRSTGHRRADFPWTCLPQVGTLCFRKEGSSFGSSDLCGLSWQFAADPVCFSDGDHPESALPSLRRSESASPVSCGLQPDGCFTDCNLDGSDLR